MARVQDRDAADVAATGFGARIFMAVFAVLLRALKIHRYRCPNCGCFISLRPTVYFPRHQCDTQTIRDSLTTAIDTGCWPLVCEKNRAQHWLLAL